MISVMLEGKEELAAYKTEKILKLKKVKKLYSSFNNIQII